MEQLNIDTYLGKVDGDTLPAEDWNGALGTVQNKVNELVSDSNTAVDYNKLDSSLKSSIDKANSAMPQSEMSHYYTKNDTGMLGEASVYDQKIDLTGTGQDFTWNDINEMLDDVIKDTTPDFDRNNFRKKLAFAGPGIVDIISYLYRNNRSTNTWSQTVEGAISIDGNGQLTSGSKYTKYTRTYTDGDANPSAWEEVGGSGSVEGAVLYDQAQSLTTDQKTLARSNIGAMRSDINPNDDILGNISAEYRTIAPTQDDFGDATEGKIIYTLKTTQSDNTINHVYFGFPVKQLGDSNRNYHNLCDAGDAEGVIEYDTPADDSPGDFYINLNGALAPIVEQNDGTMSNAIYYCIARGVPVSEFEFRPLPIGSVSTVKRGAKEGIMYTLTKRGWTVSLSKQLDDILSAGMMVQIA